MKKYIVKQIFSFNKRDRRGIIFLFSVLLCSILGNFYFDKFYQVKVENFDFSEYDSAVLLIDNDLIKYQHPAELKKNIELFNFDPNKASELQLEKLGLNHFQVNNIIKYRKKGGEFKNTSDLKKIYGINNETYNKLEPYIHIQNNIYSNKSETKDEIYEELNYDLNTVNDEDIIQITGINIVLARRIIKYRELLGGFYSFNQLNEVFSIDSSCITLLKKKMYLSEKNIKKLSLQKVTYNELKAFPYINNYQAKAIKKYMEYKGNDARIEDLIKYNILDTNTFRKISYYIDLQYVKKR